MVGDDTITHVLAKASRVTCHAIHTTIFSCVILRLYSSSLKSNHRSSVAGWVRVGTDSECNDTTFCSPGNIPGMYQSIKGISRTILTATFSIIPSRTITGRLPIRTKRRAVPSSLIGFLTTGLNLGVGCLLVLFFQSSWISYLLMMLRPSHVRRSRGLSRSLLWGWPTYIRALCVGFEKSATIGDVTRKPHSSMNAPSEDIM